MNSHTNVLPCNKRVNKPAYSNNDKLNITSLIQVLKVTSHKDVDELLDNEFIVSVAKQANSNLHFNNQVGTLYPYITDKQYNAVMTSFSYNPSRVSRSGSGVSMPSFIPAGMGINQFHDLDLTNFYDLPMVTGNTYTVELIKYKKANQLLLKLGGNLYRITKLPWMQLGEVKLSYKRTALKGFIKPV